MRILFIKVFKVQVHHQKLMVIHYALDIDIRIFPDFFFQLTTEKIRYIEKFSKKRSLCNL